MKFFPRTYVSWAINYIAFYVVWVVCILSVHHSRHVLAISIALLFCILHLIFVCKDWRREIPFIAALTAYGAVNESLLSFLGAVSYEGALWMGVSWWTLILWAAFATTYWHAFSWMASKPLLSALLGATVAPICYAWMNRMGAIEYPNGETTAMLAIGAVWACSLPCTFFISRFFQRSHVRNR